jgi:hypothetical protein
MITIIRRELPPWRKRKSQRPAVWPLPLDFEHGDRLPRWLDLDTPLGRAILRGGVGGGSTAVAYAVNSAIFAAPAAVHTILDTIAPAGHGLACVEAAISFDGVTASAVPVYVEVCVSTQATAGTAGTAPTIQQTRGVATGGSAPTASGSHTAEPTALVRVRSWYVSPNGGLFVYPLPLGREVECGSTTGTQRAIAMRITPPATVNAQAYMEVEAIG